MSVLQKAHTKKGIFSCFFLQPVMYANWCHQTADIITLTVGQICTSSLLVFARQFQLVSVSVEFH